MSTRAEERCLIRRGCMHGRGGGVGRELAGPWQHTEENSLTKTSISSQVKGHSSSLGTSPFLVLCALGAVQMADSPETSNSSLQVHVEVSSEEYVVFGVVLFLWELVPTTFVVLFFRAQRLSQNLVGLSNPVQGGGAPWCQGGKTVGNTLILSL